MSWGIDYFEDDVFAWGKRAREEAMTPTGFEGMSAEELLTSVPSVWPGSPNVRRTHPLTSHEAADAVQSRIPDSHAAVMWIFENEERPLNVRQIKEIASHRFPGMFSDSRLQTVPSELAAQGRIELVGVKKVPGDKRNRQVWQLREEA